MLTMHKMKKEEIRELYAIALRSFQPDYEEFGVYPPLINTKKQKFMPPRIFGKTIMDGEKIIGGAFVVGLTKKGEIGAIFLDPNEQQKGHGKKVMLMIEEAYPKVKKWKLDTPKDKPDLHRFYESLGYVKNGEISDEKSGMSGYIYEKIIS
jgi:GNAT superfamily N-acetyltransferase